MTGKEQLAYLAGMIDGEGSINICRWKYKENLSDEQIQKREDCINKLHKLNHRGVIQNG